MEQRTRDRIVLEGMEFFAFHGVHEEEGTLGARFVVDAQLHLQLPTSDSIRATVDYGRVYRLVEEAVTGTRFKLIEALAGTIARRIMQSEELVDAVLVRVHKPHAPLPGIVRDVYVEVTLERGS